MKKKTFTYNEIIKFFNEINLPLTKNQIEVINEKQREEMALMDDSKEKQKEKANERLLKKLKRKDESWKKTREMCS